MKTMKHDGMLSQIGSDIDIVKWKIVYDKLDAKKNEKENKNFGEQFHRNESPACI